jgi:hypothetical protein
MQLESADPSTRSTTKTTKGYGLYNEKKRKKGFYMYKSYQGVS